MMNESSFFKLFLSELVPALVSHSLYASFLFLLVAALIRLFERELSPGWKCALWLLVIARFGWPFDIPSPVSIYNLLLLPAALTRQWSFLNSIISPVFDRTRELLQSPAVSQIWLMGFGLLILRFIAGYAIAIWRLRNATPINSWDAWWMLEQCKHRYGLNCGIALCESPDVKTPCLIGLFHRRLILPKGALHDLSLEQLRDVFMHEAAHVHRSDIVLGWLLEAVQMVHWFNPFVWSLNKRLIQDREEACDAIALAQSTPSTRLAYGNTLFKFTEGFRKKQVLPLTNCMTFLRRRDELIHRLEFILSFNPYRRTWVVGGCLWLAVAVVGFTKPSHPVLQETASKAWVTAPLKLPPLGVSVSGSTAF